MRKMMQNKVKNAIIISLTGKYTFPVDFTMRGGFSMSALDATVSMLEAMPEDARIKVMEFTQQLFTSRKPENPFISVGQEQVLSDLAESRSQIDSGQGINMAAALNRMGKQHGFI